MKLTAVAQRDDNLWWTLQAEVKQSALVDESSRLKGAPPWRFSVPVLQMSTIFDGVHECRLGLELPHGELRIQA